MKGDPSAALRCARASGSQLRARVFHTSSSSSFSRSPSSDAESSTRSSFPSPPELGESEADAFKRQLQQLQTWRRRREALHIKEPFIPPGTPQPPSTNPLQASLSTLLATGAALGHSTAVLNQNFAPYIFGNRAGLSIIDLEQTLPLLRRAAALVRDTVRADGVILFVGQRPGQKAMVEKAKKRLEDNGFAVAGKWMPGLLTNSETFFGTGPLIRGSYKPDLVIFLNPTEAMGAIRECTLRHVPTIGIVDSDADPRIVTYAIPANSESLRTAELIMGTLSIAGQEGRRMRIKEETEKKKQQAGRGLRYGEQLRDRRLRQHEDVQRRREEDEDYHDLQRSYNGR